MIEYTKYGRMTPEFAKYQQDAWDKLRSIAEEITTKAIEDGVCPNAIRDTMKRAIVCGNEVAANKAHAKSIERTDPTWHMGLVKGL